MVNLLFRPTLKRLNKFYEQAIEHDEFTYNLTELRPGNFPKAFGISGLEYGKGVWNNLCVGNYRLGDIPSFNAVSAIFEADIKVRSKVMENEQEEIGAGVSASLATVFYKKLCEVGPGSAHLRNSLECFYSMTKLVDKTNLSDFAEQAFKRFVLNKGEPLIKKKRKSSAVNEQKRVNLLFLLKEINSPDIASSLRGSFVRGIKDELNIATLLQLLLSASTKKSELVVAIFREMLAVNEIRESILADMEVVLKNLMALNNQSSLVGKLFEQLLLNDITREALKKDFLTSSSPLHTLYKNHPISYKVAISYYLGSKLPIGFLFPRKAALFHRSFLNRHRNRINNNQWDEILKCHTIGAWDYIAKSRLANSEFIKARENIINTELQAILSAKEPLPKHYRTLSYLISSKHPYPAHLLLEQVRGYRVEGIVDPAACIQQNLSKLFAVLDSNEADTLNQRKNIFNILLDAKITPLLVDNNNNTLPQFIKLVQKHTDYSLILKQRLTGKIKPKAAKWQLARALTTSHFSQLFEEWGTTWSFFRRHPADKLAIHGQNIILEQLKTASDVEAQQRLFNTITSKKWRSANIANQYEAVRNSDFLAVESAAQADKDRGEDASVESNAEDTDLYAPICFDEIQEHDPIVSREELEIPVSASSPQNSHDVPYYSLITVARSSKERRVTRESNVSNMSTALVSKHMENRFTEKIKPKVNTRQLATTSTTSYFPQFAKRRTPWSFFRGYFVDQFATSAKNIILEQLTMTQKAGVQQRLSPTARIKTISDGSTISVCEDSVDQIVQAAEDDSREIWGTAELDPENTQLGAPTSRQKELVEENQEHVQKGSADKQLFYNNSVEPEFPALSSSLQNFNDSPHSSLILELPIRGPILFSDSPLNSSAQIYIPSKQKVSTLFSQFLAEFQIIQLPLPDDDERQELVVAYQNLHTVVDKLKQRLCKNTYFSPNVADDSLFLDSSDDNEESFLATNLKGANPADSSREDSLFASSDEELADSLFCSDAENSLFQDEELSSVKKIGCYNPNLQQSLTEEIPVAVPYPQPQIKTHQLSFLLEQFEQYFNDFNAVYSRMDMSSSQHKALCSLNAAFAVFRPALAQRISKNDTRYAEDTQDIIGSNGLVFSPIPQNKPFCSL